MGEQTNWKDGDIRPKGVGTRGLDKNFQGLDSGESWFSETLSDDVLHLFEWEITIHDDADLERFSLKNARMNPKPQSFLTKRRSGSDLACLPAISPLSDKQKIRLPTEGRRMM